MFGYLDPGTGSIFLQMSVAGLLGGLFTLKVFWRHLKAKVLHRG